MTSLLSDLSSDLSLLRFMYTGSIWSPLWLMTFSFLQLHSAYVGYTQSDLLSDLWSFHSGQPHSSLCTGISPPVGYDLSLLRPYPYRFSSTIYDLDLFATMHPLSLLQLFTSLTIYDFWSLYSGLLRPLHSDGLVLMLRPFRSNYPLPYAITISYDFSDPTHSSLGWLRFALLGPILISLPSFFRLPYNLLTLIPTCRIFPFQHAYS